MRNDSGMISEQQYLSSMESFNKWLYENYQINNRDALTDLFESPEAQEKYLKDMGLPPETELV
jgi:hypothetical protein